LINNRGFWYALGAYGLWGVFPIYWKLLQEVPAFEILNHRMTWSLLFLAAVLAVRGEWAWLRPALSRPKTVLIFFSSAILLGANWFTYIWGVNAGYIVETSLGYFINPLVSVLLGVLFLQERLRPWQWAAIGLAAAGVLYLTINYGSLPWIALVLAFTFAFYGLLRKTAPLSALQGLSLETAVLFLPALGYLIYLEITGAGSFGHVDGRTTFLLAFAGVATAVPLLLFGAAARRITLSSVGIMQYIAPTLQFLIGVFIYREPFSRQQLFGFSLVWLALLMYVGDSLVAGRRRQKMRFLGD